MGMRGWQARKKSYNRTTCLKSDRTWPNQVISQLRAKMVPTSALGHTTYRIQSRQIYGKGYTGSKVWGNIQRLMGKFDPAV